MNPRRSEFCNSAHWNDTATGTITDMTHGTTRAHLARATFAAIALQIMDVFTAMEQDMGHPLSSLRADGDASGDAFLMQLQADLPGRPVQTAKVGEVGALGAAARAFAALGHDMPRPAGSQTYASHPLTAEVQCTRSLWAKALPARPQKHRMTRLGRRARVR